MNITCFDDLLTAARTQPQPQTLLMVFVDVELPPDASPQERARFEQGQGGALTPRMCVDRSLVDLTPRHTSVIVDLHEGEAMATVWTNDLTHDYVHENSAYAT